LENSFFLNFQNETDNDIYLLYPRPRRTRQLNFSYLLEEIVQTKSYSRDAWARSVNDTCWKTFWIWSLKFDSPWLNFFRLQKNGYFFLHSTLYTLETPPSAWHIRLHNYSTTEVNEFLHICGTYRFFIWVHPVSIADVSIDYFEIQIETKTERNTNKSLECEYSNSLTTITHPGFQIKNMESIEGREPNWSQASLQHFLS